MLTQIGWWPVWSLTATKSCTICAHKQCQYDDQIHSANSMAGAVDARRCVSVHFCNFKFWLNTICLPIYYAITSYCIAFSSRLAVLSEFRFSLFSTCNSSGFLLLLFISFGENVGKFIRDAIIWAFWLQWESAWPTQLIFILNAREWEQTRWHTDVEMQFSLASHTIKLTCLTQHFTNCAQLKQFHLTILRCASGFGEHFHRTGYRRNNCWIFEPHANSNMLISLGPAYTFSLYPDRCIMPMIRGHKTRNLL